MASIAAGFVRKLYRMLDDEDPEIIGWESSGTHFTIRDEDRLDATVLAKYYRGKINAFRQQLINHGFICETTPAGMETYHHVHFIKGNPGDLDKITFEQKPKIKPKKTSKPVKGKSRPEPYPTRKPPPNIQAHPEAEGEIVWNLLNRFMTFSNDKMTFNTSLTDIPGFTPSMVQLNIDDPPPAASFPNGQNPLFAKSAAPSNPLFAKEQPFQVVPNPLFAKAAAPSTNPLFQKSASTNSTFAPPATNPLFDKQISNPLFDKSATSVGFAAAPTEAAPAPAKKPLFQRNNSLGDQWQHLVSSSVDRFMQFSDTFASPEDTFKFIMEERQKLGAEMSKVPPQVQEATLFNGLATQGPDALLSFLMGSSIDLLQKSVDTFDVQGFTNYSHQDDEDDDMEEDITEL